MPIRQLSPYELNQLRKYGLSDLNTTSMGDKPIEYVTGHAEFCGHDFLVNSSVLIPRLESEQIISMALSFLKDLPPHHLNIADIGTGSGCLGISLAHALQKLPLADFNLYLSDISTEALEVARNNAGRITPNLENISIFQSDLLQNYPEKKFDLIMANLPYIPSSRIPSLDPSVKDYEPANALDGGPEGTSLINNLLQSIKKQLQPSFQTILEIDSQQTIDSFIIPEKCRAEIKNDSFNRPRFLIISPQ